MSYAYYYGYNCYGYGCLSQPPGAQLQDPNPLADIEVSGYVPPTTYTSTQSFTALCPTGTVPMNTVSAIPVLAGYNDQGYGVSVTSDTPGFEGMARVRRRSSLARDAFAGVLHGVEH